MWRPRTLFAKTIITIAIVSIGFLLFTLSIIGYFMLVPVGQRSADDLAALMVLSSESWARLPAEQRPAFSRKLARDYQLRLTSPHEPLPKAEKYLPYFFFLETALSRRYGREIQLVESRTSGGEHWYWAELAIGNERIRIGLPRSHVAARPPMALLLLLSVGSMAILMTALALVHHWTTPLERLSRAAYSIGQGVWPARLPETGPEELRTLARSFNDMTVQVQELLANRTTLLAGISHDLRTPLARIQLALEMLPENADPALINGIRGDVEQMNCLIGQFLEVSRGLDQGSTQSVDIHEILDDLANCARRGGALIEWEGGPVCHYHINPLALRRIVVNLLENAVRYSGGNPVTLRYDCEPKQITIRILDRGPGIPPDQREAVFRPFHRLERSRSSETGGSGLGLSIARQLAKSAGLSIGLHEREGGGTEAVVTLPC
ncbi:MAG: ATP-binding protein [Pseudomonadota bacterium]